MSSVLERKRTYSPPPAPRGGPRDEEKERVIKSFRKIKYISEAKATQLYDEGFRTLDDLKTGLGPGQKKPYLDYNQTVALKYYDDLLKVVPYDESSKWVDVFYGKLGFLSYPLVNYNSGSFWWAITGGYRRNFPYSDDLDLILMSKDGKLNETVTKVFKLLEDVIMGTFISEREGFISCLIRLDKDHPVRVLNITAYTRKEWPFALLYTTGPATFVRLLEQRAEELGRNLNPKELIHVRTEEDIFDFFKVEYVPPNKQARDNVYFLSKMGKDIPKFLALLKEREQEMKRNPSQVVPRIVMENGADLEGLTLVNAKLSGVQLIGANLRGAKLQNVTMSSSVLSGADLSYADLSQTNYLMGTTWINSRDNRALSGTKLTGAKLIRTNFTNTNLYSVSLNDADLTDADLTDADLTCATTIGANFTNTIVKGALNITLTPEQRQQANPALTGGEQEKFDAKMRENEKNNLPPEYVNIYLKALLVSDYNRHSDFMEETKKNLSNETWKAGLLAKDLPKELEKTPYFDTFGRQACDRGRYNFVSGKDKPLQPLYDEIYIYLDGRPTTDEIRLIMQNLFSKLYDLSYFKM